MLFKFKNSADLPKSWFDKNEFAKIINKEINLSFRTGLALSLISVDLSKIKSSKPYKKNGVYKSLFQFFVYYISENMREEDFKCYRSEGIIDILLINTDVEGAATITSKIYFSLNEKYKEQSDFTEAINDIHIKNNLLNQIANTNAEREKTAVYPLHKNKIGNQPKYFVSDDPELTNLDVNVFPNGLISITDTYSLASPWKIRDMFFIFGKTTIDIAFTLFNMIFFSPLMILIAIAIKLSSKGPVFFKQERYGQFKKPFTFYKFRTMKTDNDDTVHRNYVKKLIQGENTQVNLGTDDKPFYKLKNDTRITAIGRLLRKTSLDELPQFLNVLKGDMSIVGPRPPLVYEVEAYKNWHLQRILSVKPGITGLWQVSGKNKTTFDEMVRLDLHYIKKRSVLQDIRIILKTIPAMFH